MALATAIAEEREAAARVAELHEQIVTMPAPPTLDLVAFQRRQHTLEMLRVSLSAARAAHAGAAQLTAAARDRWVTDQNQLAAVESLVERRASAARAERIRRENHEMDAVAQEMWRRNNVSRLEVVRS